jgi:glycosyltransferase involved in cell wall biosynthesis
MSVQSKLRIIVSGLAGLCPVGGMAWHYLQYVLGLARLGHEVCYHEDTWSWPYHPRENTHTADGKYSAEFIDGFFRRYAPELRQNWHYLHLHDRSYGMERRDFDRVAEKADLFLNVSGACFIPDSLSSRCIKAFIDTDPGYNQIMLSERFEWSENVDRWCASVATHDRHLTFAENIHGPDCGVPKLSFDWQPTRMPMVAELWDDVFQKTASASAPWTTVMTWNAFKGPVIYKGVEYKSKGAEFTKLLELPSRTECPLQIAVGGKNAPLELLSQNGWQVLDGPNATLAPEQYVDFITNSRGELSPAKHIYVALRTGWFSERSACYLAAGRPVIVQDTGFGAALPIGEGLLTFNSCDEALEALCQVEQDYERHRSAARSVATEYFAAEKVLPRLLETCMS